MNTTAIIAEEHEQQIRAALAPNAWELGVDVGANGGLWTRWMAERCAQVLALEPHPDAYGVLAQRTIGMPNVRCHQAAAWFAEGMFPLSVFAHTAHSTMLAEHPIPASVPGFVGAPRTISVLARTLDSLCAEVLREHSCYSRIFVKVDVEGAELEVLHGAVSLVERGSEWLVECHSSRTLAAFRAAMGVKVEFSYGAGRYLFGRILDFRALREVQHGAGG